MKISKNPNVNWANNAIQFPRLIAELESVGAINGKVMQDLVESMDLTESEICDLIDRAQTIWDNIKKRV